MSKEERSTTNPWTLGGLVRLAGPGMVVLWVGGVLLSTLLFPSFSWTSNTLAEVGRAGQPSALLFDSSLAVGSLLGVAFLSGVWSETTNLFQRVGIALIGLLILLTGLSQLGLQNPWFELIALAFILLLLPALALFGSGDILSDHPERGIVAIWLGIVHVLVWQIVSIILGFSAAIPTFISIILVSVWIVSLYTTTYQDVTIPSPPFGRTTDHE